MCLVCSPHHQSRVASPSQPLGQRSQANQTRMSFPAPSHPSQHRYLWLTSGIVRTWCHSTMRHSVGMCLACSNSLPISLTFLISIAKPTAVAKMAVFTSQFPLRAPRKPAPNCRVSSSLKCSSPVWVQSTSCATATKSGARGFLRGIPATPQA